MAISLKHKFQSAKGDSADTSLIRPSNWNDDHDLKMVGPALVGRSASGTGDATEITLGSGLSFSGGSLNAGTIAGRALTVSSSAPSGGADGDVHFQI